MEADSLSARISDAVRHFWTVRSDQATAQKTRGVKDQGRRAAVTGGAQMDGFIEAISSILAEQGFPVGEEVFTKRSQLDLPGYFRSTKRWDLVVVRDDELVAAMEVKSHIGPSFGNNFNNRTEEALGNAVDIWTAFREKAFQTAPRPWLGYVMMLEDAEESRRPVRIYEPHFPVFPEFQETSYAERYAILLDRLVRERHYDAAALVLSGEESGLRGEYSEPESGYTFTRLVRSLTAHLSAF